MTSAYDSSLLKEHKNNNVWSVLNGQSMVQWFTFNSFNLRVDPKYIYYNVIC